MKQYFLIIFLISTIYVDNVFAQEGISEITACFADVSVGDYYHASYVEKNGNCPDIWYDGSGCKIGHWYVVTLKTEKTFIQEAGSSMDVTSVVNTQELQYNAKDPSGKKTGVWQERQKSGMMETGYYENGKREGYWLIFKKGKHEISGAGYVFKKINIYKKGKLVKTKNSF